MIPKLKPWLALDIDDTLAATFCCRAKKMQKLFGNPEWLKVEDLLKKYHNTYDVPYRQTPEAEARTRHMVNDNEWQKSISMCAWASTYVKKVNKIIPITAYITVRPSKVMQWTKYRLKKFGFPDVPIIHKPDAVSKMDGVTTWKMALLNKLYPTILGIVDDNIKTLGKEDIVYPWTVFLYGHEDVPSQRTNILPCKTWKDVYLAVKEKFGKKK